MGLNDAAEMLEAAKADNVQLERDLTRTRAERDVQIVEAKRLQRELDAAEQLIADQARRLQEQTTVIFQAGEQAGILWRERHALEQQIDEVRRVCRGFAETHGDAVSIESILAIIGTQAAPSGDEHDRHA